MTSHVPISCATTGVHCCIHMLLYTSARPLTAPDLSIRIGTNIPYPAQAKALKNHTPSSRRVTLRSSGPKSLLNCDFIDVLSLILELSSFSLKMSCSDGAYISIRSSDIRRKSF